MIVGRTVGRPDGQKPVEEFCPVRYDVLSIGSVAKLPFCLTLGIAIDDDHRAIVGLAARFGFRELRRVERPVTTTTDNDDVSQRISLPPSTTRIVPVT